MGIGSIGAMDSSMSGAQRMVSRPTDSVSKNIQNEISDVQRRKQALSSKEDMPVEEKSKKRQELQQEIGSLNVKLRQRETLVRKQQESETKAQELRTANTTAKASEEKATQKKAPLTQAVGTDNAQKTSTDSKTAGQKAVESGNVTKKASGQKNSDNKISEQKAADLKAAEKKKTEQKAEKKAEKRATQIKEAQTQGVGKKDLQAQDNGISTDRMRALTTADSSVKQQNQQNRVITRTEDGIVILKGEIRQDELQGTDTGKKQEELQRQEEQARRAATTALPDLGGNPQTAAAMLFSADQVSISK